MGVGDAVFIDLGKRIISRYAQWIWGINRHRFFGGHGTAAAITKSFSSSLPWEEVGSLAMTSATVGIFAATLGGIILIQWGIYKKETQYLDTIDQLPSEFRTGIIPQIRQDSMGKNTFSSVAIDPLLMHVLLIFNWICRLFNL